MCIAAKKAILLLSILGFALWCAKAPVPHLAPYKMEYRNPVSTEHKIIPAAEACCCVDDGPLNCLCGDLIVRIDGAGAANYGCDDAECSQLNGEWRLSLTLSGPTHCEWRAYHGVCEYPGQGYIIADLYKDWLPWYGPLPGYGYFKIVVQHEHNPPNSQHWSLIGEYGSFEHEGVTCADLLEFPLTITRIIGTNTLCGGDDYNITLLRWEDSPLP